MWSCCKTVQADHRSSSNTDSPPATSKNISYECGSSSLSSVSSAGNTLYPISRSVGEVNPNGQILQTPNLRIFSFAELKKATNNFRSDTVLGEGFSGKVFKGWIDDNPHFKNGSGYAIAVKKLNRESTEEMQSNINFLGRLSHPNLVKLLGYCCEEKTLLLVYEFMEKGSLDRHLFSRSSAVQPLSWNLRLKIVLGAAKGLAFLHSLEQIMYWDFKDSNILLDGNYNGKLSDFGLTINFPVGDVSHVSTRVKGTYGYAAPEYIATGHLSYKSDVYGFGVVLLEMLTGQRALDTNRPSGQKNLVDWLKPSLSDRKKVMRIMDPRLDGQCTSQDAIQAAELCLKCLGIEPKLRPSMKEVVESLNEIQASNCRPKESRTRTRHLPAHNRSPLHQNGPDRAQLLVATEIVGQSINKTAKLIFHYLMDPMIGIIGIHGMGKTVTMMNINAQLVTTVAFDRIIWVTVSKVLSLDDVQNEIAKQLNVSLPVDMAEVRRASMLSDMLKKLKFLIILDDVWEPIPLEKVGVPQPSMENGCKVVLTTRSKKVCHCMSTDKNIHIGGLSDEEAWDLFVSKAGDQVLTPDIRPIASKVVGECLSHPLVIITVGHALRECSSFKMWDNALMALRSSKTKIEDPEEVIYKLLRLGYSYLKNHMVQQCFLYCAFFPEDYLFEPSELIRYWMAEGLINEVGDMVSEIYEGFKILKELKDAGLLHVFKHHLRMHAIFRGLAIDIMSEQSGLLFMSGLGLKVLPYDLEWANGRKISLMRNRISFLDDLPCSCSTLLTLLLRDNTFLYDISPSFFSKMFSLQVLDISCTGIAELPSSLSHLVCLHTLFLQQCTSLRKIPSVENLKALLFLNLRGTSIRQLPKVMEKLVRLRFLDLSETKNLVNVQEGVISSLCGLEELHLQGSRLCKMDTQQAANSLKEIRCLTLLQILTLSAVGFGDHLDTITCLQEKNLVNFSIDMYGSVEDVVHDVKDI